MAEIMLSFGHGDVGKLFNSGLDVSNTHGSKVLLNEGYTYRTEISGAGHFDPFNACRALSIKGSRNVILDARLSADNPTEMYDAVKSVLARASRHKKNYFTHISANYLLPEAALAEFVEILPSNIKPVFMFPTSRFTTEDLERFGASKDDNIIEKAAKCSKKLGAILMLGAIDAEVARNTEPDLEIIGMGAALDLEELRERRANQHVRPALIEDTAPFVDVLSFGYPVFGNVNPNEALRLRQELALQAA